VSYFINREISWLKFNKRVLEQADSVTVPMFERMRFLSIFVNNLDEFFMVRAGSLHDRSLLVGELPDNKTGMTAREQLDALYQAARPLYAQKEEYFRRVREGLAENGIVQLDMKSLSEDERAAVHNYFKHDIQPLLSPQIIDARHPFPHLENKKQYILASLSMGGKHSYGIIPVNDMLGRLLYIDCGRGSLRYLLIEDIMLEYVDEIFRQFDVTSRVVVRITRNADVEVADNFSDEDVDYRDYMAVIIKKRERLAPVRLEAYTGGHSKGRKPVEYLMNRIGLGEKECYYQNTPLDLSYVSSLDDKIHELGGFPRELFFGPLSPRRTPLEGHIENVAKKRDVLLSYPYYSMKPYLDMLERAAKDDSVVSIRITLYRMASSSEVVRLLCLAAENGRDVTVLVELKARFDESNNISWSRRLEDAGCRVIYGMEGLKVHSKITLITRKTDDGIGYTAHIATGNYNEKTARQYTDLGIITTDARICRDAASFFNNITLGVVTDEYESLFVAPLGLKKNIIKEIQAEIQKGEDGYICMKMNGLTDKEVIDELAAASQAGVAIDLIVRGICCLLPGIEGKTDNIRVISIVGRFLEHSRIFIFGKESEGRRTYIGSADLMTRNTSRRVEILTPVYDEDIAARLYEMTRIMLRDNVKSSRLCSNGNYEHVITDEKPLDSQIYFYDEAYKASEAK